MLKSLVRRKLAAGETILTAKSSYDDPALVELIGTFGFDALWICLEHRRAEPPLISALIQACRLHGMDALIRVRPSNYTDLLWLLEAGARGIMLPRVRHADEVRECVAAMKFPQAGRRGFDGVHAEANFGRTPAAEYLAQANDENFLVVQIEEPAVAPQIEAIAALPGVDVLFVGPGDLTLALGAPGRLDHPDVRDILQRVAQACARHGKAAGIPCAPPEVPKYREMGYTFFNVTSSYRCMLDSLLGVAAELRTAGIALPGAPASLPRPPEAPHSRNGHSAGANSGAPAQATTPALPRDPRTTL